jgi:hypothetical protein
MGGSWPIRVSSFFLWPKTIFKLRAKLLSIERLLRNIISKIIIANFDMLSSKI